MTSALTLHLERAERQLSPAQLLTFAQAAPGSVWAYDYLSMALANYDKRVGLNDYVTLQKACVLCGHEGGPCIAWARKRVASYGAGFSTAPLPHRVA